MKNQRIEKAIEEAKQKVLESGTLDFPDRYKIYMGYGEPKYEGNKAVLTEGLRKRVALTKACIKKVVFIWEEERKGDYQFWRSLELADLYLEGNVTAEQVEKEREDFINYILDGNGGPFGFYENISWACICLMELLLEDIEGDLRRFSPIKLEELKDEDIDPDYFDLARLTVEVYILYENLKDQDLEIETLIDRTRTYIEKERGNEKLEEFWSRYLNKVFEIIKEKEKKGEERRKEKEKEFWLWYLEKAKEIEEREGNGLWKKEKKEKIEQTGRLSLEEQRELLDRLLPIEKGKEVENRGENLKKRVYLAAACVKEILPLWESRYFYNRRPEYLLERTEDYLHGSIKKEELDKELKNFVWEDLYSLYRRPFNDYKLNDCMLVHYEKREEIYGYIGKASLLVGYLAMEGRDLKKGERHFERNVMDEIEEEFEGEGWNAACLSCKVLVYDSKEEKEKKEKEKRFWLWYVEKLEEIVEKEIEEIEEIKRVRWRDLKGRKGE